MAYAAMLSVLKINNTIRLALIWLQLRLFKLVIDVDFVIYVGSNGIGGDDIGGLHFVLVPISQGDLPPRLQDLLPNTGRIL